jgi:hypothetical protein
MKNRRAGAVHLPASRAVKAVLVATALLTLSALACGAHAWLAPHAAIATATLGAAQQADEMRVVLRASDFDPASVERAPGHLRLVVVNQSGRNNVTLRLKRMGGEVVRESQVPQGASEWSDEFDLQAGKYVLSDVTNPACLFYVIVQ